MTSFIKTIKMTDRPVIAACPLGASRLRGTGLSSVLESVVSERPTQAPAAVTVATAPTYAFAFAVAANGAGSLTTAQQQHPMWAFRGLKPWSYRT
ncbi:hypothetical protein LRS74_11040 [Streptomyces sp. LX-29]|uniref:hypothetical protein n=1 Tax=Streptomyces sp. LX-29 TaxID=2900152 RepID=UPI00240DAC22|nr:hypothetical protein [Streptomyces sp. LX-29]WFB07529.1 hypothetical protein LRS74_11040 [Streptomyces sp. LX-29]